MPAELAGAVHNVTPRNLGRQLDWLNTHFKIVPLDAMFDGSSPRGRVAITFDDGYKSVFTEAAPLLFDEEFRLPSSLMGESSRREFFGVTRYAG